MTEIKDIKTNLAAAFNVIKKALRAGQQPDEAACQALIEASKAMAAALDRAQTEAARFIALAEEVAAACAAGDLEAAARAHGEMKDQRNSCHEKYK